MTPKLDRSHKCVIENWKTVKLMETCADEVEKYLHEVAQAAFGVVESKFPDQFEREDQLKKGYIQLIPKNWTAGRGSKSLPIAVGLEGLEVERLVSPLATEVCSAFIYSPLRANSAVAESVTAGLAAVVSKARPLKLQLDVPERGYLYKGDVAALEMEKFCQTSILQEHLSEALFRVVRWYLLNAESLRKAIR